MCQRNRYAPAREQHADRRIARFAHRAHDAWLSLLLEGYGTDGSLLDWRLPLYAALWLLVDAIVDHGLGGDVDESLQAATDVLAHLR